MTWLNQLFKRRPQPIPDPLWESCIARLPFLHRLSAPEQARLKDLSEQLLSTTTFSGAGGFVMTDDIAVRIVAQAALPVLNLTLDLYDDLHGIVVYPAEFIVPQSEIDEDGVVHEWREPVAGEAFSAGGPVVLSWEDVESGEDPLAGHNVLIHEFVHKIDMEHGDANGRPPFLAPYHQNLQAAEWHTAFAAAYADFSARVEILEDSMPDDADLDDPQTAARTEALFAMLPLDPYAATHPAEFFAVASEAFFVKPTPLATDYPAIYRLLSLYYCQNTLPLT